MLFLLFKNQLSSEFNYFITYSNKKFRLTNLTDLWPHLYTNLSYVYTKISKISYLKQRLEQHIHMILLYLFMNFTAITDNFAIACPYHDLVKTFDHFMYEPWHEMNVILDINLVAFWTVSQIHLTEYVISWNFSQKNIGIFSMGSVQNNVNATKILWL